METKKSEGPKRRAVKSPSKKTGLGGKANELLKTGREKLEGMDLQPIWEKAKREFQGAVKALGKGTEKAAEKTAVMGKQAGIQYQLYLNQLKLQKLLADLGGRVYDLKQAGSTDSVMSDAKASEIIRRVEEMNQKILALKEESRTLRSS